MRSNLPVSETEYSFPRGETLVSTTDLKGRITYCNKTFVQVSGYEHDELMGQPHNIIRHPDMPEETFRDMWDTIANGRPWSALVKNRRKNGDFYWVTANVTPLFNGEQLAGYMSVRTEASREQTAAANALYSTMRDEVANGQSVHRLRGGLLYRANWMGALGRLLRLNQQGRLTLISLALGWSCAVAGILASAGWAATSAAGLVTTALIAATLAASVGWLLTNLTNRPLDRLLRFSNRMAAGDLTRTLEAQGGGVMGQLELALNQLCVNVRAIVRDARTEVEHMRDVTREIAAGNLELSARTESQASSLEQTASSMEQITGTVRQSAQSARQVSELATQATDVTQRSSEAVRTVTQTMQAISDSSIRIAEIIQVIDSIAFQTNILALNAAVEAARAGDQGRGFAVVAAEVRSLSQRTSSAAREVKKLIEDSAAKVEVGERQTRSAQATMDEALGTVKRVSTVITEINTGANEQLLGISQVNEAVAQLDTITQQNAAMVEELASSAQSLQGQAAAVAESVSVFRLGHGDHNPSAVEAVALRRAAKLH